MSKSYEILIHLQQNLRKKIEKRGLDHMLTEYAVFLISPDLTYCHAVVMDMIMMFNPHKGDSLINVCL